MVRKITLSDGKQIPALAFGTGSFGHLGFHDQSVADGVRALEAGFRHLDTAQMYETERAIAESIKRSGLKREDLFVTTKLSDNVLKESTPDAIRAAVQSSLDNLGFKPDAFLIHNPFVIESGRLGAAWQVLESLVEDGTLAGTSLGVSNFRTQDLEEVLAVAKIKPVINQMEYHPFILAQNAANGLDALQKQHGITYQAYGPLAPILRLQKDKSPLTPVLDRVAQRLSRETGKTYDPAAVLLLWNVGHGVPVVTTSGNPERIKAIADLDGAPDLSAEEMREIDEVGRTFHFRYYSEHMTKDYPQPDLPTTGNSRVADVKQWFGKDIEA